MSGHDTSEITGLDEDEVHGVKPPPVGSLRRVLLDLLAHPDPDVQRPVLKLLRSGEPPETLEDVLEAARRFADEPPVELSSKLVDEELSDGLAGIVLIRLAISEHLSVALLENLARVPDAGVRNAVADRPYSPTGVQRALAQDEQPEVRETVGGNPLTAPEILLKLADDRDPWVRLAVATNPNTPTEALLRLAADEERAIHYEVARSSKVAQDNRLALAVRLAAHYPGDPQGLEEAVDAVLG